MSLVFVPFVVVFFLFIPLGLMVWALVDLVQRPKADWDAAGQDRLVWALIVMFVGLIGPILYLTIGRKKFAGTSTPGLAGIVS